MTTATATIAPAARLAPWRQVGTIAHPDANVLTSMNNAGLLGWGLRKQPLVHLDPTGIVPIPDKFVNIADIPGQGVTPVGVVGDRYWNLSNEVVAEFVSALVSTGAGSGATVDSLGTLYKGARVFTCLRLEGSEIVVAGGDVTQMFLNVLWSHDGSTPVVVVPSPTRLSCTNQLRGLTLRSEIVYKVRHLSGAGDLSGKIKDAQAALSLTSTYVAEMRAEADALMSAAVTDKMFAEIIAASFPEIAKANAGEIKGRSLTMAESRQGELWGLWNGSTVAGAGIGGTAWGALQAIGEYVDWQGSVKGSGSLGDAEARAVRAMGSAAVVEGTKHKARSVVGELVGV